MEFAFLLKKFVSFFVEPFGIVVTLFVFGLYFFYIKKKSRAELFLASSLFLLLLFSYPPFANFLVEPLESKYAKFEYQDFNNSQDIKYIHVLGNGHTTDKTQPISSQLSDGGTKRVLEGVIIHKNIANSTLIFTGYKGKTETPNAVMNARLASSLGVSKEDMMINGLPVDTKEEALFTQKIVGEKPFILVTSATHMPRAMMLFESLGMHPIAAPTNFHKGEFLGYLRAPAPIYFHISSVAFHEYLGMLWSKLKP